MLEFKGWMILKRHNLFKLVEDLLKALFHTHMFCFVFVFVCLFVCTWFVCGSFFKLSGCTCIDELPGRYVERSLS